MEKEIDIMHEENYASNCVTVRGRELCDEWNEKKFTSRKIADSAKGALGSMHKKGTKTARLEALAHLFALDLRIKEKYNTVLSSLFAYFAWKSETEALELMRKELRIPEGKPLLAAIEEELRKILENDDEEDEGTHGGRSNGMTDEEAAAEGKEATAEEAAEEKGSEPKEGDERKEEKAKEADEKTSEKSAEKEATKEKNKEAAREEKAASEAKNEQAARGANKTNENNAYNNAYNNVYNNSMDVADFFVASESHAQSNKEEQPSFIDELAMDKIAKEMNASEKRDRTQDVEKEGAKNAERGSDEIKNEGKRFDDKAKATEKGDALKKEESLNKGESLNKTGNAPRGKNELSKADAMAKGTAAEARTEDNKGRVAIQVDITESEENAMRQEISIGMTEQMVLMFKTGAESAMREQLSIASAQLGIEAPVQIVGETNIAETAETKQNIRITERK